MSRTLREAAAEYREAVAAIPQAIYRHLRGVALTGEARAKENATTSPRVRSGVLRRSIRGELDIEGDGVVLGLSAGDNGTAAERYAMLQERGGRIVPRDGQWLAIPTGPALTGAGVARYSSARQVAGLRVQPIRGGTMGLLVKDVGGRRARSEVWFYLVRSAQVPATRFLARAWEPTVADARTEAQRALDEVLHAD